MLDKILSDLRSNFPLLKHTVVVGHGSGADALHRYAYASVEAQRKDVKIALLNPTSMASLHAKQPRVHTKCVLEDTGGMPRRCRRDSAAC